MAISTAQRTSINDVQDAGEEAYKDLERESMCWTTQPPTHIVFDPQANNFALVEEKGEEEEEELFDPFQLHSSSPSFNEYYVARDYDDYYNTIEEGDHQMLIPKALPSHLEIAGEDDQHQYALNESHQQPCLMVTIDNSSPPTTCTPINTMTQLQAVPSTRHSDYFLRTKRKTKSAIPIHRRLELLQHQSHKSFRAVSKAIVWSAQRLHNMIHPELTLLSSRQQHQRLSMFRRRNEKGLALGCDNSSMSLPDLQQATSLDSTETGSSILESSNCILQDHRGDTCLQKAAGGSDTNDTGKEDVRWLFARQQLPATESEFFQFRLDDGTALHPS
jgi:hypothetical protein